MAQAAPVIFVLLWSTGFIGAKLGLPHAEPFTFLTIRMLITLAILAPVALVFVRPLPGMTPLLMLSSGSGHTLAAEQRNGVSLHRVAEFSELVQR